MLIDSVKRTLYNTNPLDDYQKYSLLEILEFYNDRKGKDSILILCREDFVRLLAHSLAFGIDVQDCD